MYTLSFVEYLIVERVLVEAKQNADNQTTKTRLTKIIEHMRATGFTTTNWVGL